MMCRNSCNYFCPVVKLSHQANCLTCGTGNLFSFHTLVVEGKMCNLACMNSSISEFYHKISTLLGLCGILYPFTYMCWMLYCTIKLNNSKVFVTNDT